MTKASLLLRPSDIELKGQMRALKLFHEAAQRVPAYRQFLINEGIDHKKIKSIEDFKFVPPVDKKNYLTKHPLAELSWDGDLFNSRIISVSSGSTGQPFFWPRGIDQDLEGAWMHEELYKKIFEIDKYSTLVVVCFSMGTWIAGSFTTASTLALTSKYKLNIVTPGIEKEEAIKVIKNLGPMYDQVIVTGYPPFIKDIIDDGEREGIKWKKMRTRFLWAGEAFSEDWRDYVLSRAGSKNPFFDSVNVYGSADAAMLGHETPVSIALRRIYNARPAASRELFQTDMLPSLAQYYPDRRYFESVDGELHFTAASGIPLIRYNIHDSGGVLSYEEMIAPVRERFVQDSKKYGINPNDWKLPFVFLNGRKDFTVTIYAVNIYPENIKAALIDPKMRSWVTGKFTMATKYYNDMDQYFEINVELAPGVEPERDYEVIARNTILTKLNQLNGEFHKLHSAVGKKSEPQIHLIKNGDKEYFANGVKHRWVQKKNGPQKTN